MSLIKFCPICSEILVLVDHQMPDGTPYQQWECPEGDWFDPAARAAAEAETAKNAPGEVE